MVHSVVPILIWKEDKHKIVENVFNISSYTFLYTRALEDFFIFCPNWKPCARMVETEFQWEFFFFFWVRFPAV